MLNEKVIEKLEGMGFRRWQKAGKDRLYINAKDLGLECEYYKTGNIAAATLNGESISNSEAYRMKAARTYIDVETGEVESTNKWLKEAAENLLAKAENAVEEAAAKAKEASEAIKWAEDAEFVVRVAEYKEEAGYPNTFKTLNAKDIATAKAKAKEYAKEVFKYVGWWEIRVYRKTKHFIPCVNGKYETFRSVAKQGEDGRWSDAFDRIVARVSLDNGKIWFEERKAR